MKKKTHSSPSKPKKTRIKVSTPTIRLFGITTAILGIIWGLLLLAQGPVQKVQNKAQTSTRITETLNTISLPGTKIYESTRDNACTSRAVGLTQIYHCSAKGYKIYEVENTDRATKAFKESLSKLSYSTFSDVYTQEDVFRVRYANGIGPHILSNCTIEVDIRPEHFIYNKKETNYPHDFIEQLVRDGLPLPEDGTLIYGVRVDSTYFACKDMLYAPCPTRPGHLDANWGGRWPY